MNRFALLASLALVACTGQETTDPFTGDFNPSLDIVDTEAPIPPQPPADVIADCGWDTPPPIALTATDNVDGAITVSPDDATTPLGPGNNFVIVRTWTFTDQADNSSSVFQTITVLDHAAPVPPTPPADVTASTLDDVPDPIDLTATDNCDGPITVSPEDVFATGSIVRTWTFTDQTLNSSSVSQVITVLNQAPSADPNGPYLGAAGASIHFDGAGSSDPDGDPLTFDWDFGDGNVGSGAAPSHAYAVAGIYDVCLVVNDGHTDSEEVCAIAVVYDPDAGFVTGGGWIDSPAGAYEADPSLAGKATFGFVSKYTKGQNTPDGNTEFQFQAGDLNFHSGSYEWLVVNQGGGNAQFKGSGTINGSGDYRFMIWAGDGPDTFRIRIWTEDAAGNETDVYDNGVDQAVGGGSIVIHAK